MRPTECHTVLHQAAEKLRHAARRVRRNDPAHGDPESFHIEKSELEAELRGVAEMLDGLHSQIGG